MAFIVYDKKLYKNVLDYFDKKEETEKAESLDLTSEEVSTLYSYLVPIKEKLVTNSEVLVHNLSQDEAKAFALSLLREEDFEKVENANNETANYKLNSVFLENAAKKILGKDFSIQKEDMKNSYYEKYSNQLQGNMSLIYNEIDNCYEVVITEPEEKEVEPFYTKLIRATKRKNQIILTEKVIYTSQEENKISVYSNWELSNLLKDEIIKVDVDDYLSDASEVIYTFEKKEENYQFVSSKIKEKT